MGALAERAALPHGKKDRRRDEMVIKHLDRVVQRRVSR